MHVRTKNLQNLRAYLQLISTSNEVLFFPPAISIHVCGYLHPDERARLSGFFQDAGFRNALAFQACAALQIPPFFFEEKDTHHSCEKSRIFFGGGVLNIFWKRTPRYSYKKYSYM